MAFSQEEYVVETSEATRVGEALAALRAHAASGAPAGPAAPGPAAPGPTARLLYGLHAARAPASARLFRLHELSGVLELAHPLDRYISLHDETCLAKWQNLYFGPGLYMEITRPQRERGDA